MHQNEPYILVKWSQFTLLPSQSYAPLSPPPAAPLPAAPAPPHTAHPPPVSFPLVQPPKHHKDLGPSKPDPYLASENELKGRKFDDPFWYPKHRHIVKGYRNKDRGDKVDHRDYSPP